MSPVDSSPNQSQSSGDHRGLNFSDRQISLPISVITSLISAMGAGGIGSWVTGNTIATEFREFRVEVKSQLDQIQREASTNKADSLDRERRIRAVEMWIAKEEVRREPAPAPR